MCEWSGRKSANFFLMIILLSPAKTLNETPFSGAQKTTFPQFWDQTKKLAEILKQKSSVDIEKLMKVSSKIGTLNFDRYQNFPEAFTNENTFPALHCFQGDVYRGIEEENFSDAQWAYAQKNLRILSGLYGVLRPLDLMYPYRLEMGTNLTNPRGKNLYEWWGDQVTENLNGEHQEVVLNLASQEYASVIQPEKIRGFFLNIHFKEQKGDTYKIVAIHAKRARGVMANWLIKNQIKDVEAVKDFAENNYRFEPKFSTESDWVFVR